MKLLVVLLITLTYTVTGYTQRNITLSHYIFSEFTPGEILMHNGTTVEASLNYNSLSEEVVFMQDGELLAIGDETLPQIDTVYIHGSKFIRVDGKFVELLVNNGYSLLAEYKCRLIPPGKPSGYGGTSQTSASTTYSTLMASGIIYNLKLPDDYTVKPYIIYRIIRGGKEISFQSAGQLKRLYNDDKARYKQYTSENKVDINNPDYIKNLVIFMEQE